MSDKSEAPDPEGTVADSGDWVTGDGGPNFTQGGMQPGGSDMENWKKPMPKERQPEGTVEEQAENLRQRVEND